MKVNWKRLAGYAAWGVACNLIAWALGIGMTWQVIVFALLMGLVDRLISETLLVDA